MKFSKSTWVLLEVALISALTACGSGGGTGSASTGSIANLPSSCHYANPSCSSATGSSAIPTSTTSSIPLYVADPNTTGQWGYENEPLVSVTVCSPNHGGNASECQVISNVLLDTGSFGLRIFGSAITNSNVQLQQQTITVVGQTMNLGECATFGTGADWGSVENGDVILGNKTATNIPIQVINVAFGTIPSGCANLCPDVDPCDAGFNGILGVGVFAQDCGTDCDSTDDTVNPGNYFGCDSSGCYDGYYGSCGSDGICMFQAATSQQVVNPVSSFGINGISVTLPSISSSGASQITTGSVGLGISSPTGVGDVYPADANGMTDGNISDFTTIYSGKTYGGSTQSGTSQAFLDSGSNGLFFPSALATCSDNSSFYCPTGSTGNGLSATVEGYTGTPSNSATFSIASLDSLSSSYTAFDDLGGPASSMFDWGLPFFFGKTIYVGLDGQTATINSTSETGPYWAY